MGDPHATADVDVDHGIEDLGLELGFAADQPGAVDEVVQRIEAIEQGLDGDSIGHVQRLDPHALEGGIGPCGQQFLFGQAAGDHVRAGGLEG